VNGTVIYQNKEDDKVEILERTNSRYYKVNAQGRIGYLFVGMIKSTPPIELPSTATKRQTSQNPLQPQSNTSETNYGTNDIYSKLYYRGSVYTYSYASIYDIPDLVNGTVIYQNNEYDKVEILERTNSRYYKVKAEGRIGYLFVGMIKSKPPIELPSTAN
jgi:hypothetical protein